MIASSPVAASRREARRHSRRETILDVAERSFLERGYAGTTMSAIAATLGGSKGTLWSHFGSKEVLFDAVFDRATEAFRRELSLFLHPRDGVEAALRWFCAEYVRRVTAPGAVALLRLVTGEAGRFPEMGRIFYERGPRQTQQLLADFLGATMDAGLLRRDDPLLAARQLTALCMAVSYPKVLASMEATLSESRIELESEQALATFMRAYAVE